MPQVLKHGKLYPDIINIFFCILFCSFLAVACGGVPPPPQHPLSMDNTPTNATVGTARPTSSASVQPIQIIATQSNIATYPGGQMHMTISTSPYAVCFFTVDYGRGIPSKNAGIVPSTADANGTASWTWRVDAQAHTGTWPLSVSAVLPNGAKTSAQVSVTVTLPPLNVVTAQTNLSAQPGGNMALVIATAPSLACTLTLNYGPTKPMKFLSGRANVNGVVSWMWRVDNLAVQGAWPLTVTATLADGEQTSAQVTMNVL
jgi:hypothetical protein